MISAALTFPGWEEVGHYLVSAGPRIPLLSKLPLAQSVRAHVSKWYINSNVSHEENKISNSGMEKIPIF
jgi:hypothetical protein